MKHRKVIRFWKVWLFEAHKGSYVVFFDASRQMCCPLLCQCDPTGAATVMITSTRINLSRTKVIPQLIRNTYVLKTQQLLYKVAITTNHLSNLVH
jgi:hypothetical protein